MHAASAPPSVSTPHPPPHFPPHLGVLGVPGFSGADVAAVCKEAAMGPVRHGLCGVTDISAVTMASMPPITMRDFSDALRRVRAESLCCPAPFFGPYAWWVG